MRAFLQSEWDFVGPASSIIEQLKKGNEQLQVKVKTMEMANEKLRKELSIVTNTHASKQCSAGTDYSERYLRRLKRHRATSVPLRTGTCYRDIFVLFLQDYCALQELLNFTIAVAPPFVHPMTSLPATPNHSVRKYGFFSEPTRRRQVAKLKTLRISVIFW